MRMPVRNKSCLSSLLFLVVFSAASQTASATPAVDQVIVYKSRKIMQLLSVKEPVRTYRIALGRKPAGHKQKAGDCRTPEGSYIIDRHKKDSRFHRALHISYPSDRDRAAAKSRGRSPGGDIMIHGLPKGYEDLADLHYRRNWTRGCIAVNNAEIEEIWDLVKDGTPITIEP